MGLDQPNLYSPAGGTLHRTAHNRHRTIAFGFRSFTVEGVDSKNSNSNALFRLNGRRIRIYSSISWGFWGLNGMWPVPELAIKEVTAAKTLGLNCLNFHRNLAKEDVSARTTPSACSATWNPAPARWPSAKLPANAKYNAAGIVMEDAKTEAERFRAAVHVRQMRRDGQSSPLASLRHRVLSAKRDRRRPQEPRHARRPQSHARRRPFALRCPQRRLRSPRRRPAWYEPGQTT